MQMVPVFLRSRLPLIIILTLGSSVGVANSQMTVSTAVSEIQNTTASSTTCPMPGVVYKNASDQIKQKNGVPLQAQQILTKLVETLGLTADSAQPVVHYDGFVTRLFDTPSTNDIYGSLPNSELLGLSTSNLDPNSLLQWGTGSATLKLDCASLLNTALDAAGGTGNLLPLATLNGSFSGTHDTTGSTTVNIITGNAQSPFAQYYYQQSGDYKQMLAALRAIVWSESDLAKVAGRVNYLKKTKFISYALNVDQTAKDTVAASITSGISIPLYGSAKGSVGYQLTNDYQLNVSHFTTYYYESEPSTIPPLSELITKASGDLPAFTLSSQAILPGDSVTADAKVQGWPHDLCKSSGVWDISVRNSDDYSLSTISITPGDDTADGFPVCTILLTAKSGGTISAAATAPQFVMKYSADHSVSFVLPTQGPFTVLQNPSFNPTGGGLMMFPVQNSPSFGPATSQVLWKINGTVQIPSSGGFTVDHYGLDATPLNCAVQGGGTVQLQGTLPTAFDAPPSFFSGPNLTLPFSSLNVTIIAGLTLGGAVDYNVLAPKSSLKSCTLTGNLHIYLKNGAGAVTDRSAPFSVSGVAFPPVRGVSTILSMDCGQPGPAANPLNLAELGAAGMACNVVGSDLDIRTVLQVKDSSNVIISAKLVAGKDSAHASMSVPASDLKNLVSSAPYSLWLTDDLGNANNSGATLAVIPVPTASLAAPITLTQLRNQSSPVLQFSGKSLKQVQQVLLVDHATQQHVAIGPVTVVDDSSIEAAFAPSLATKLTAAYYDILFVIDATSDATFDPHLSLQ